jgi:hypothetical protein
MTAVENSRPVVALIRLIGYLSSAPSRRADRAQRALSASQDGSHSTQTASQPLCSVLGCAGAVVAAPHGWAVCSAHLPEGVMIAAR